MRHPKGWAREVLWLMLGWSLNTASTVVAPHLWPLVSSPVVHVVVRFSAVHHHKPAPRPKSTRSR